MPGKSEWSVERSVGGRRHAPQAQERRYPFVVAGELHLVESSCVEDVHDERSLLRPAEQSLP